MSYTNEINTESISSFTTVSEWQFYFNNHIRNRTFGNGPDQFTIPIYFSKLIIEDAVLFDSQYNYKITFEDCYFKNEFRILNAQLEYLNINRCYFDQQFTVARVKFNRIFQIINIKIKDKFTVYSGDFPECNWSFQDKTRVIIQGGSFQKLSIGYWGGSHIGDLHINSKELSGKIDISRKIEKLQLTGDSDNTSYTLSNISLSFLSIYRFRNEKGFRIIDLNPLDINENEIAITESYMGKAEFYDINFMNFKNLFIRDSHLIDCSFTNVNWKYKIEPLFGKYGGQVDTTNTIREKIKRFEKRGELSYPEQIEIINDPDVISFFKKQRETYRQLKYGLGKQGDIINEQKFHSLELNSHYKTLTFKKAPETKLILWFSYFFSDYGQSISRPLIGLLIGHWFLFLLLIITHYYPNISISLSHYNKEGFEFTFGEYFRLINPLRRSDQEFVSFYVVIDILMRVWASYMIYNLIRATRRFIK